MSSAAAERQPETTVRTFDLHRSPERRAYFTRERPGIFYDGDLRCYVVDDRELIKEIVDHPHVAAIDYLGRLTRAERPGCPMHNSRFTAEHMPIWMNGAEHRQARRAVGRLLNSRRTELLNALPDIVRTRFAPFGIPGTVQVMESVLIPLLGDIGIFILGIDPTELRRKAIGGVFDRLKGVRSVERLDAEIGAARAIIRDALGADHTEEREGVILALMILSHDTLLGTLGESLHHALATNPGARLSDIALPDLPPETGVPFIEREVIAEMTVGGVTMPKGASLRLMMQAFAYADDEEERRHMFGIGQHACLGKPLALDVWNLVRRTFAGFTTRGEVIAYAPRTTDQVFTCPEILTVRIA